MIEGQEGVTWEQWCALAAACEEHGIETLFRSDHYISQSDGAANVAHDAWTTIAALAARTTTPPLRHARLPRHVPPPLRCSRTRRDRRPRLRRPRRARARRRLDGARAPRLRLPVPGDARRASTMFAEQLEIVHRLWTEERVDFRGDALHARGRAGAAEAGAAAAAAADRRRQRQARHRRARRCASPTSTTRRS